MKITYQHFRVGHFNVDNSHILAFFRIALAMGQVKVHGKGYHPQEFESCTKCTFLREIKRTKDGIILEEPVWGEIATGYAFCSTTDNFSRKEGRKRSIDRAIDEFITQYEVLVEHCETLERTIQENHDAESE